MKLKEITVQQWVSFGLICAGLIAEIVSVFCNPWAAIFGAAMFVGGAAAGYLFKNEKTENTK